MRRSHPQRRLPLRYFAGDRHAVRSPPRLNRRLPDVAKIEKLTTYWKGLLFLLSIMRSPINVCVFADPSSQSRAAIAELVKSTHFSTTVTLSVVYSPFYGLLYPANLLKNVAVSTVFTTHFLVVEPTMLPSRTRSSLSSRIAGLYERLRSAPVPLLYEPINLVTIPVVRGDDRAAVESVPACLDDKSCAPTELAMMVGAAVAAEA